MLLDHSKSVSGENTPRYHDVSTCFDKKSLEITGMVLSTLRVFIIDPCRNGSTGVSTHRGFGYGKK
ncbi:MAG: hypothetical protein ACREA7_08240 [Nitrosotalea sp.]